MYELIKFLNNDAEKITPSDSWEHFKHLCIHTPPQLMTTESVMWHESVELKSNDVGFKVSFQQTLFIIVLVL